MVTALTICMDLKGGRVLHTLIRWSTQGDTTRKDYFSEKGKELDFVSLVLTVSDIPQFFQSRDAFRPIKRGRKYLILMQVMNVDVCGSNYLITIL